MAADNSADPGPPDPCWYTSVSAPAGDSRLQGHAPTDGTLYDVACPIMRSGQGAVGVPDGIGWVHTAMFVPTGATPAAPPPDPAELARTAIGQLTVPDPVINMGPNATQLAVKVPVWLWIDDPGPRSVTVTAGGLSVTATATVTSTEWSMGEPVDDPDQGSGGEVAPFTCTGLGSPPPAGPIDRTTHPACGYTYIWRSTPARTRGTGQWNITVTAHWTVKWTATNGATGEVPLQAARNVGVHIGEWRTLLVDPNSPLDDASPAATR